MADPFDIERWSVLLLGRIEAGTPGSEDWFGGGGRWEASCPPVESLLSRNERLSRAISLDKIRKVIYVFLLTESARSAPVGAG